jgi:predicted cupin superfamily sugar epimerase
MMGVGARLTADEVKATLGLEPHPTCGFVAETYRSPLKIPAATLPETYDDGKDRPYGSALYFLVAPDAQIVMHRIRSDQHYHHYMGDPLEVLMLYPDGTGAVATVGTDLAAGERPQLFVPGGTFHTSRLAPGGAGYALLASTEWPGVEPPDVEHGDIGALIESFPDMADHIRAFTSANGAPR